MIRVVIADDHQILREGLKQLLLGAGDLDDIDEAADGHQVLDKIARTTSTCCCSTCRCRGRAAWS